MSKPLNAGYGPNTSVSAAPRFSWPMRLFLSFIVFDMVFHSLAALTPYLEWMEEMKLARFPERLPTAQEIYDLQARADAEDPTPALDRVLESLDSVWDYFKPWPSAKVRRRLDSWEEKSMFVVSWLTSRLDFFESLAGIPQRWTMFSPNASRSATVARIVLVFEDNSQEIVRLTADPEDLTHYSHWFQEKVLDYELRVAGKDWDSRFGYCNYLSHKHARNADGSPLQTIFIYEIKYRYPDPDEDAHEVLAAQNGPPGWDQDGPNHQYDVAGRELHRLKEAAERKAAQKRLASARRSVPGGR